MEAKEGKKQILLFRLLANAAAASAVKLAFQTEHDTEKARDNDTTETKDGNISIGKGLEEEIPFKCIVGVDDPTIEMLEDAINKNEILEVWEVDLTEEVSGKYASKYRQGLLTEMKTSSNAADLMEIDCTFITNGIAQKGMATLTTEQKEVVQYKFRDTTPYTEA